MSSGSPRPGPSPRSKCGLKKRRSIGQQSWTKGQRKASKLSKNCRARGGTNDPNALGAPTQPLRPTYPQHIHTNGRTRPPVSDLVRGSHARARKGKSSYAQFFGAAPSRWNVAARPALPHGSPLHPKWASACAASSLPFHQTGGVARSFGTDHPGRTCHSRPSLSADCGGLRGSASPPHQGGAAPLRNAAPTPAFGRNDIQTPYAIDRGRRHEERPSERRFCGHFAGCLGADDFDVTIFDRALGCALTIRN
jgi:hypothetical protein